MKLLFPLFFIAILSIACNKNAKTNQLPDCLNIISPEIQTIKLQIVNGEKHYWLSKNSGVADIPEAVINEECDTVCYLGGYSIDPISCRTNYSFDDWVIIWEK